MQQEYLPRRITIEEMSPHVHSFGVGENKVNKIADWLSSWIITSLKTGKIKAYDFLPLKGDLAFHIGVSSGTIQNAYRILEDKHLVASKQRVGTYIKAQAISEEPTKLTSKREEACAIIKKYIIDNNISEGELLIPSRELAKETNISDTTLRLAINHLILEGIVGKQKNRYKVINRNFYAQDVKSETLVKKIADNIWEEIKNTTKTGNKLPSNTTLAKKYNVSVKTIYDAIRILIKKGIVFTKRGRYGTIVAGDDIERKPYFYQTVETKIKNYIIENCKINDKLPSIKEFSKKYSVSPKTIKKALDELQSDGYVNFLRGKFGGTFVTDIPGTNEGYTWLAISQDYIDN